jgi:putative sigma-54 modulation protein
MQINLTGHHVDITEPLKGYVDTKFDRLARHFDHVIKVHVILSVEKLRQKAEATIRINGANVFAETVHEDMYAAIDGLIDKLDRQVLKYKEKRTSHRGSNQGQKVPGTGAAAAPDGEAVEPADADAPPEVLAAAAEFAAAEGADGLDRTDFEPAGATAAVDAGAPTAARN